MRLVVPTSRRRAPALCTISGMRKPSPISTSWPRETTISRPPASAASASTSAAAPLLTQIAASAPVSSHTQRGDVVLARAAPAGREVELQVRVAGRDGLHARERGLRQRRAAEVGVQDDAGGVEHRAQRRLERGAHAPAQLGGERAAVACSPRARRSASVARASRRRARAAHRTPPRARARRPKAAGWPWSVWYGGRARGRRSAARGTLPVGRVPRPLTACRGGPPRQRHAGARILSVDDAARDARAMRLYGRQSRVRARRRRVLMSFGVVVALLAIPLGHLVLQRGAVVERRARRRRAAGRLDARGGGAPDLGRRGRRAAPQGDRDRGRRSATLSPYELGVRVDAARTASAALEAGRVRGGLLFSFGYSRSIDPCSASREPGAAGRARRRDAGAGQRAPRAQAERRGHRDPRQARRRLRSRRGAARDHARRARRSRARSRCAPCPRRPRSRPRPRAAPSSASRSCSRRRSR